MSIGNSTDAQVEVAIDGIDDLRIVGQIESNVRAAFRQGQVQGRWTVALAPSDTSGRWDVGIKGPRGRHVFSFSGTLDRVPDLMSRYLSHTLVKL